jgi:hypothetical protein
LDPRDLLGNINEKVTLIVQAPLRTESVPIYFILPETRENVAMAVLVVVEEGHTGVGIGVFFSPTQAVTCNHNLKKQHTVRSVMPLALKKENC